MSRKRKRKNPLDEPITEFLRDHADLFYAIWQHNDMPSDSDMDIISEAWYDTYEPDLSWTEVEDRLGELAMEFDWSFTQMDDMNLDEPDYGLSDFLYDSSREERLFGGGTSRD